MEVLTERLRLRPFSMSDTEEYYSITQDEMIQRYFSEVVCSKKVDGAKKVIERIISPLDDLLSEKNSVVIENKEDKKMIGAIIVCEREIPPSLDMSLMMSKDHRRKGYMTEALKGFIRATPFGTALSFRIKEGNEVSLKAIQKLGKLHEHNDPFDELLHYKCFYLFL